jgi:hypothetical protein
MTKPSVQSLGEKMRRQGWLLAVIACAVLAGPPSSGESAQGESDLRFGRKAALEGRYDDAVKALTSAVAALKTGGKRESLAEAYLYLGMAQLGLRQDKAAGESLHQAATTNPALVLSPSQFSPRMIELFRAGGGRIEGEKKKSSLPLWILSGAVGVGGPTVAYLSKKSEQDRANSDYNTKVAAVEQQNAEAQQAASEWNAQWSRDDDGDGFSEDQGDCNDRDATISPNGKITVEFNLLMDGSVDCDQPFSGTETVKATNHSCTTESVTLSVTGTYLEDSECWNDTTSVLQSKIYGASLAPGETKTLYTATGRTNYFGCWCSGPTCHWTSRYTETFTLMSSQGAQSKTRTYWYNSRTCPICSSC